MMTWMFDNDRSHILDLSTHLTLGVLSSATLHDTPAWSYLTTSCAFQPLLFLSVLRSVTLLLRYKELARTGVLVKAEYGIAATRNTSKDNTTTSMVSLTSRVSTVTHALAVSVYTPRVHKVQHSDHLSCTDLDVKISPC